MMVRAATDGDVPAIATIHVHTWQAAYANIVPAEYLASLSVEKYEANWRRHMAKGVPQVLVAVEGSEVLGWVAFGPCRDEGAAADAAEIWAIYVAAAHWGRGVGGNLWRHVHTQFKEQGFRTVSLWAFPENVRAAHFYRALGFQVEPRVSKQLTLAGAVLTEVRYVREITA